LTTDFIISSVDKFLDEELTPRLILLLILIALLSLAPRPHAQTLTLGKARLALNFDLPRSASLHLVEAAEYQPWRAELWEMAGHYALQGDDPQRAFAHFRRALAAGTLTASGYTEMGDAAQRLGDLPAALQAWQTALQNGDEAIPLYTRLEVVHRQLNDYPALTADLRALTTLQPADASTFYRLGLVLAATQPESALAYLTRAAELDAIYSPVVLTLWRSITTARLSEDSVYTLLLSGRALAAWNEWTLATEAFRRATELRPDYAEAWAFLGEALQRLSPPSRSVQSGDLRSRASQPPPGLEELEKAVTLDPQSLVANLFLALYWQRQLQFERALGYLHAAAEIEPRNPILQAEIGNTFARTGDLPTAQTYYQRATELSPNDAEVWRWLASFYIRYETQLRDAGLSAARQAVLLDPNDPASLDTMAQIYTLLDDPLSAQRFLARALRADPNYAPARLHLGLIYLLEGDPTRAYHQLTLARSLAAPDSPAADQSERLLQQYFP
jgi:tetratricopeptide (TPR) repeat protein